MPPQLKKRRLVAILCVVVLATAFIYKGTLPEEAIETSALAGKIDHERLRRTILDLQSMGERASWENQARTSRYLQVRLETMGLRYEVQTYSHEGKSWENVVATFPGTNHSDKKILAVAHYDSKNWISGSQCPGADDNATGVAVLLEIAKLLEEVPHGHTVQLVFFSNEEYGRPGSVAFARKAREEQEDIRGVINVDIVGYNDTWAILSREVFDVLGGEFTLKRKAKMLGKMAFNLITSVGNGSKNLKLVARSEDAYVIPDEIDNERTKGLNSVKWIVGDVCA